MTTPEDALADLRYRVFMTGNAFPCWAVPSSTGRHVALLSEQVVDRQRPLVVALVVRAATLTPLVEAGLLRLGEPEDVPEYEGRRGFWWKPGAAGCRITWAS
ncbi:hypothetical protein TR631_33750 [Streptomyces rochei]|uniref:hypothetical protein n=1 Tax=Streptomyces rochei TaxID=1928 RepID=UPI002ACE9FFA|nr:hypothetical protein [Streptomyces rochei]WQC16528.1 hypothetical protein TR631_33750 [Streptomyces rochei]